MFRATIDNETFELSDFQQAVIQAYIPSAIFEQDMFRRLEFARRTPRLNETLSDVERMRWILQEKYLGCLKRLIADFGHLVKASKDLEQMARDILEHPNYQDRDAKEAQKLGEDSENERQAHERKEQEEARIRQIIREEIARARG